VWLNLGDSYSAEPPGRSERAMRSSTLQGRAAAATLRASVRAAGVDRTRTVPRKNLLGMPWRVAMALQADGWILRNAVVWAKRNPMPESVQDRLSATHEFVFLLVKQPRYFFDLDAIRVPLVRPEALGEGLVIGGSNKGQRGGLNATARRRGHSVYRAKYSDDRAFTTGPHGAAVRPSGRRHDATHPRGKNPGDVWHLSTRPLREAHFAAFPIDIPLRCIAAGCPEDGLVLDPFSGAATTGLAALQLGRRYIGIELNASYNALAKTRLLHEVQHPEEGVS
jgi:site-specific DNA-methyltransferase (cytosine-N4-specific)